jgi:chromosome partitioning protein
MSDTDGYVIVVGNEKGGAGKSTVAMHLSVALMRMEKKVGVIDLDLRQRTFMRYLDNRRRWIAANNSKLPMPNSISIDASTARNLDQAEREEAEKFDATLERLRAGNDFVIIDAPGGDSFLSRRAHSVADTLITPLNDSFVDFDLLGDVDPIKLEVLRPSYYSEMVWVVMRNRMSALDARNKQKVGEALRNLSNRIGFRLAPGLSERVIFRELFPMGLTLLDLGDETASVGLTMSHVAARQELRDLVVVLKLPGFDGDPLRF